MSPKDVRFQKNLAVHDRAVDMGFGGKMKDGIHSLHDGRDQARVADVSLDETDGPTLAVARAFPGARVGQNVEIEDFVTGMFSLPVMDEVRADKPGSSSH